MAQWALAAADDVCCASKGVKYEQNGTSEGQSSEIILEFMCFFASLAGQSRAATVANRGKSTIQWCFNHAGSKTNNGFPRELRVLYIGSSKQRKWHSDWIILHAAEEEEGEGKDV